MYSSLDIVPGRSQRLFAAGVSVFLGIVVLCTFQNGHRIMPVVPQFLTINMTVAVLFDLFVALVLALQYRASGYRPIGVLTMGYCTTATIAIASTSGFPGILSDKGLFGANAQTFIWLWIAWHAVSALLVMVYALARRVPGRDRTEASTALVWSVAGCGCALGYTIAVVAYRLPLPILIVHAVYTPGFRPVEGLLFLATVVSIGVMIAATRLRSVLDLWLTVANLGMLGELILTSVGGARFSAGWYVARILGQTTTCVVALTFFSELAMIYMRMSRMAFTDQLTGLGNRRTFDQRLDEGLRNSTRERQPIALLLLDVDDFKKYNDLYGHIAGDEALKQVGASIRTAVARPHDTAARYGGEEFAVILPNTSLEGAITVAERIRAAVVDCNIPHEGSRAGSSVTVSIGIAIARESGVAAQELILRADTALYDAKANGRNTVSTAAGPTGETSRATAEQELSI